MRTFINPRIGIFLNTDEVSSEIYKETYLVFQRPPLATLLVKSRSAFAEINSRKFLWKKFPRVRGLFNFGKLWFLPPHTLFSHEPL